MNITTIDIKLARYDRDIINIVYDLIHNIKGGFYITNCEINSSSGYNQHDDTIVLHVEGNNLLELIKMLEMPEYKMLRELKK